MCKLLFSELQVLHLPLWIYNLHNTLISYLCDTNLQQMDRDVCILSLEKSLSQIHITVQNLAFRNREIYYSVAMDG